MKVLVAGHRSFAAKGLVSRLESSGHDVTCFSRGPTAREGDVATGPVLNLTVHPDLRESFDVVINFIVLKGESVNHNQEYARALLRFCREREVDRLIQISSISVYPRAGNRIDESTRMVRDPDKVGIYAGWKVAADRELLEGRQDAVEVVLVRPGFILGPGLMNPVVGNALRLPSDRLLCLGNPHTEIPVISRDLVHDALERAIETVPVAGEERAILLLASPESPSRIEYLQACCEEIGLGTGVRRLPVLLWLVAGLAAEVAARLLGWGKLKPLRKIRDLCSRQSYDTSSTENRLGLDFSFDWRAELRRSLDGQESNVRVPSIPQDLENAPQGQVDFLGVGRIVGQRHLPALDRLGHRGEVRGYDPIPGERHGLEVSPLAEANLSDSDLVVVASPGPKHSDAIPLLRETAGTVIVEKPLCYTAAELEDWRDFAADRKAPVYVCHDYRLRRNVTAMLDRLTSFPAGRLLRVDVLLQSPPVAEETSGWLRRERKARTLVMDYSLHFLDLGCMFGDGPWRSEQVVFDRNDRNETSLVEGRLAGATYAVNFCLRQGFIPRIARIEYVFQNLTARLSFFPGSFSVQRSNETFWHHARTGWRTFQATVAEVLAKALGRSTAGSHARLLGAALSGRVLPGLKVEALIPFYRGLHHLADEVYGSESGPL